ANDGERLMPINVKIDIRDCCDATKALADSTCLKHDVLALRAHHLRSRIQSSIVPNRPRRKNITMKASMMPSTSIHACVMLVIQASSTTNMAAPTNGPRK